LIHFLPEKQINEGWRIGHWPNGLTIVVRYVNHYIVEAVLKTTEHGLILDIWKAKE